MVKSIKIFNPRINNVIEDIPPGVPWLNDDLNDAKNCLQRAEDKLEEVGVINLKEKTPE